MMTLPTPARLLLGALVLFSPAACTASAFDGSDTGQESATSQRDGGAAGRPDAATGPSAPAPAPPAATSATPPSSATPPPPSSPIPASPAAALVCGVSALCLDVEPLKAGTTPAPGRLVVVWKQLDAGGLDPKPEIGFEVAFAGTETRIEIPLADIKPPSDANMLCARACTDEIVCPCSGEPKVGTAYVLLYADSNQDGKVAIDYEAKLSEPVIGAGQVLVAVSDKAFPTPPPQPGYWKNVFPSGIEAGTRPYSLVKDRYGFYQRFGAGVAPGTSFPLRTCDAARVDGCKVPIPNPW